MWKFRDHWFDLSLGFYTVSFGVSCDLWLFLSLGQKTLVPGISKPVLKIPVCLRASAFVPHPPTPYVWRKEFPLLGFILALLCPLTLPPLLAAVELVRPCFDFTPGYGSRGNCNGPSVLKMVFQAQRALELVAGSYMWLEPLAHRVELSEQVCLPSPQIQVSTWWAKKKDMFHLQSTWD